MNMNVLKDGFKAALPIIAGYIVLGLPCGLLCQQAGINALESFVMSMTFYSGAGQYMIPNMWLAAASPLSIIASVSLVNTRQTLYSASLSQFCTGCSKRLAFLFSATVTDESFGVNLAQFQNGEWDVQRATVVNLCSMTTWALANVSGVVLGSLVSVPTALASFAMTAIFICLLCMQKVNAVHLVTMLTAAAGVVICKLVGLSGAAILLGAVTGVVVGYLFSTFFARRGAGEGV
ncbi:MAG: AzlC family ABC transporter permease [Coriobacteriales bacterium]